MVDIRQITCYIPEDKALHCSSSIHTYMYVSNPLHSQTYFGGTVEWGIVINSNILFWWQVW
jgi:hypothetical protein